MTSNGDMCPKRRLIEALGRMLDTTGRYEEEDMYRDDVGNMMVS